MPKPTVAKTEGAKPSTDDLSTPVMIDPEDGLHQAMDELMDKMGGPVALMELLRDARASRSQTPEGDR